MAKQILRISIPLPPSINHAYYYHNNRKIRTAKTKAYDKQVQEITIQAMKEQGIKKFPDDKKIRMNMWFHFPDARKRDTHNTHKIPIDAMEGIVYSNDYWVLPNFVDFDIDRENPRLDLELYVIEERKCK
jgi:crossover junction endodeoxyribonuclease RusA